MQQGAADRQKSAAEKAQRQNFYRNQLMQIQQQQILAVVNSLLQQGQIAARNEYLDEMSALANDASVPPDQRQKFSDVQAALASGANDADAKPIPDPRFGPIADPINSGSLPPNDPQKDQPNPKDSVVATNLEPPRLPQFGDRFRSEDCKTYAREYLAGDFESLARDLGSEKPIPDDCLATLEQLQKEQIGSDWEDIKKIMDSFKQKSVPAGPVGNADVGPTTTHLEAVPLLPPPITKR